MNQPVWRLIMLSVLCAFFFSVGITLVAAQGPDNAGSAPQTIVEDVLPIEAVMVEAGDTTFTVSWKTQAVEAGWVEYGTLPDKLDGVAYDERGRDVMGTQHQVALEGLEPDMVYYFVIVSGGEKYDNAGSPFKVLAGEETELAGPSEMAGEVIEIERPTEIAVAEVGDTQFTVVWKTQSAEAGWVEYGTSPDQLDGLAYGEKGQDMADIQHQVTVDGLELGTVYYFVIVSGGEKFDNTGSPFKVLTDGGAKPAEPADRMTEVLEVAHPTETVVTEVGDTQFTVTWKTVSAETGWVEYGSSLDQLDGVAYDERGQDMADTQHRVTVEGLEPGTVYYFLIVSGGEKYDNAGSWFKVLTNRQAKAPQTELNTLSEGVLVYNRIGIEAGHGGSDSGSMSCNGQFREADNTIGVANLAAEILRGRGYTVDIFRGGDTRMQGYRADAFVSLHNDFCASGARGFKVSRYGGRAGDGTNGSGDASDRLVQNIWDRYRRATDMVEDRSAGHFTRNMLYYYALAWIASETPGAIIEMGWWSGDEDMLLNQRGALAAGVADSILAFLSRTDGDDTRGINSGQTLNGTIDPANDEDTYHFNASQGQRVTIRMNRTGGSLDSYLILYAPNGSIAAQNDDGGGNLNALIDRVTLPQSGRYRIVARSYAHGSTGWYSLSLNPGSGGGDCNPGANGVVLYEHHYAGRCVTFTGDHADFTTIGFNDVASSIRFVGSYASGWEAQVYEHTYYGGVSSTFRDNDSDFGNDTIRHDRASSIRIRRVNSDPDDGRVVSSGQTLWGTINPASDEDTYYFDASQGQRATIRMTKSNFTPSLDPYLILYAPNGSEVTRNDDGGGNLNALIDRVTLPQSGRYRIVARSWNHRSSGQYSLGLNLESGGGGCNPGANGVVLYEHVNYTGRCVTFTGDDRDFINNNFNDVASSIRFVGSYASGWEAQVYEHTYYGGVSSTFRGNDPDFGNDTIRHDRASSIRIRRVSGGSCDNIGFEQTVGGWLSNFIPGESYCFTASAGQWVSIRMFAYNNNRLDTYIKLYAPDGRLIARDDDGAGVRYNSFLVQRLPQSGTYRLEATRYGSTSGDYRLRLEGGREAAVGDIDRNCVVNARDVSILMSRWGTGDQDADLNLDGIVNSVDSSILQSNFGRSCP